MLRIKPIILGAASVVFGISAYFYSPNLVSQFMISFTGTTGSNTMATGILQQMGIPPIQEMDQMIRYSFGGLAVTGVLLIVFGIFAKKKLLKQFSNLKNSNHAIEESQDDTSQKSIHILKERLAKGEITADDFVDLKKLLEEKS
jgi:uncharacterized membrane protein